MYMTPLPLETSRPVDIEYGPGVPQTGPPLEASGRDRHRGVMSLLGAEPSTGQKCGLRVDDPFERQADAVVDGVIAGHWRLARGMRPIRRSAVGAAGREPDGRGVASGTTLVDSHSRSHSGARIDLCDNA
jgi:hypothetical protein